MCERVSRSLCVNVCVKRWDVCWGTEGVNDGRKMCADGFGKSHTSSLDPLSHRAGNIPHLPYTQRRFHVKARAVQRHAYASRKYPIAAALF